MNRIYDWLPRIVDRRVRVIGWLSLIGQLLLIASGGAVRLTGSGLGCPTWPKCTGASLTNTPEMGIHGIIEFSNRLLSAALIVVVIVAFVFVIRMHRTRPDLFWIAFALGMSIPLQGVVGGITVLSQLNPYVVGLHFVVSIALVALSAILVMRIYATPGARTRAVPAWYAMVAWVMAGFAGVTILVGILTTGSGPHAGDRNAQRNGLNSELLQHVHSLPAYATFGLTIVLVTAAFTLGLATVRMAAMWLLLIQFAQIGVGLIQANTGLPGGLVVTHMVLAGLLAAATAVVLSKLTSPAVTKPDRPVSADQPGQGKINSSGSIATARNSSVK
ncbi:MAG: COX15/CtaA family protein [Microbacteriaceae bacterium]